MERELPTINNATLSCSNYSGASVDMMYRPRDCSAAPFDYRDHQAQADTALKRMDHLLMNSLAPQVDFNKPKEKQMAETKYRVVKIFIVDTDENVPLDKSLVYTGDEKFTDATDQELFFDVDIKKLLDDHNAYRAGVLDKKQTNKLGQQIFLEPLRIRDLTMTVVNVATF